MPLDEAIDLLSESPPANNDGGHRNRRDKGPPMTPHPPLPPFARRVFDRPPSPPHSFGVSNRSAVVTSLSIFTGFVKYSFTP